MIATETGILKTNFKYQTKVIAKHCGEFVRVSLFENDRIENVWEFKRDDFLGPRQILQYIIEATEGKYLVDFGWEEDAYLSISKAYYGPYHK